ncbi:MAG: cohesin domain-containing protein, partial [Bacteroidota bacterium]
MLWFDPQLNPTSIPDGEALVTVCFQIENDLNTPINLSLVVLVEPSGEAIDPVIVNPGAVNGPSCGGVTPTCNDGIQNGNETGVDCGGPDCPACPTCNDGIQNGNETGVDCGGSCTPCTGNGDEVTFSLNTVTGMAGDQVCLNVTVANFTAIAAFQYSINYDPAILQFTQVTNLAFPDINVVQPVSTPGEIRTSWNYFQPDNLGETLPDGAILYSICFNILQNIDSDVIFSNNPIGIEVFGTDNNMLPSLFNNGGVNIGAGGDPTCTDGIQNGNETGVDCGGPDCPACPTCNDGIQNGNETGIDCGGSCTPCDGGSDTCGEGTSDLTVCVPNICASVGTEVCLDLLVSNFTNVVGFQFDLNYAGANLEYTNGSSSSLSGVLFSSLSDGTVRALWADVNGQGNTLPANTVFATICFNVEADANTPITMSEESFADPLGNTITPIAINPGSVNGPGCSGGPTCNDGIQNGDETGVDCGGSCTPCDGGNDTCGEGSTDITVCVPTVCAAIGTEVCLDLLVTNFTNVVGFQFDLNYNGANLDYTSGSSSTLSGVLFSPLSDGTVRALWADINGQGNTLPENTVFATICFNVDFNIEA